MSFDMCADMGVDVLLHVCTDMLFDMSPGLCIDMSFDMSPDIFFDMSFDGLCIDMSFDMSPSLCIDMSFETCTDMCIDMFMQVDAWFGAGIVISSQHGYRSNSPVNFARQLTVTHSTDHRWFEFGND